VKERGKNLEESLTQKKKTMEKRGKLHVILNPEFSGETNTANTGPRTKRKEKSQEKGKGGTK